MPAPSTTWIRTGSGDPPDAAERGAGKDGGSGENTPGRADRPAIVPSARWVDMVVRFG